MENNNYITRDLYEADKQATIAKCEAVAADVRTEGAKMKGDYNLISARFDERFNNMSVRFDEKLNNMSARFDEKLNNMNAQIEDVKQALDKFVSRATLALGIATVLFTAIQITLTIIALRK